ncbi:MAG: hypothetical protein O3C40_26540 [Planctomycetota bacterium]|nr:hypothetical protein [Planctomycetota bacterium]
MRIVCGSVSFTLGLTAALISALLLRQAGPLWLIVGWPVLTASLLTASVCLLRGARQPPPRRLILVAALVAGLVGAILAVFTSGSGTVAVSNDAHQLWVRVLATTYNLETGPVEPLYARMLLWGSAIGFGYVAVASTVGSLLATACCRLAKRSPPSGLSTNK